MEFVTLRTNQPRNYPASNGVEPPAGSTVADTVNTGGCFQVCCGDDDTTVDGVRVPGGRRLWCRMVIGFVVVAAVGAVFITVGAVYFKEGKRWADKEGLSMPMVFCVVSMVVGVLFIGLSIVLGKLIISNKWRKNQQPQYRNMAAPSVHYHHHAARRGSNNSSSHSDHHVEIHLQPPSYEESANDPSSPPNIFFITGGAVNLTINQVPPPAYTENNTNNQQPDSEPKPPDYNGYTGSPQEINQDPYSEPPNYTESSQLHSDSLGGNTGPRRDSQEGSTGSEASSSHSLEGRTRERQLAAQSPGGSTSEQGLRNEGFEAESDRGLELNASSAVNNGNTGDMSRQAALVREVLMGQRL